MIGIKGVTSAIVTSPNFKSMRKEVFSIQILELTIFFEYGAMHSVHALFCAIAMMIVCVHIKVVKTLTLIN